MRFSNFCLIIYPWGITICFQVILAKFIVQLLNDVGNFNFYEDRKNEVYNSTGNNHIDVGNYMRIIINLLIVILGLPLTMRK